MLCFYCTCSTIVSLLAASAATTEVLFHMTKTTGCETNVSDLVARGASCKWWETTRQHFVVLWQKTAEAAGQLLSTPVDKLAAASRSAAPSRSSTCSVSCAPQKMTDSFFFFLSDVGSARIQTAVQPTRGWTVSGWWIRTRHEAFSCSRQRKERKSRQRSTRLFWTRKTRLWS